MKKTRAIILSGSAVVVVLAAGSAVAATQLGHHKDGTALPAANCGSATTHAVGADTVVTAADPGALSCFDAAARACNPASIQVVAQGVDAGTTYVFRINSGGTACRVTELSQTYVEPGRHSQVKSVTCDRTGVSAVGVNLSCDGQDVLIPAGGGTHEHPGV
jgi:hypothetical protein